MIWLDEPTRFLFFTGKGGVGKTSLACATAVRLADIGMRVLLVSTDPASNLGHVFETDISPAEPTPIAGVPNLDALNVDPDAAALAYRDRIIGPVRGVLPEQAVRKMEEELSGACTTEIAAFDEFTELLTDGQLTDRYDRIIFDTAPTGHTLRLLRLPGAWTEFLDANTTGASCLGPLAGLDKQRHRYAQAVRALSDAASTTLLLVSRAERATLDEAARTSRELAALGVAHQRLIINGLMPDDSSEDPLAHAMRGRQQAALSGMPSALDGLPTDRVELRPMNLVGVDALRALLDPADRVIDLSADAVQSPSIEAPSLGDLVGEIESDGPSLIMVMGKGGVGKTAVAAAVAVELAARGHDVHLTTTDPAAHVAQTVGEETPGMVVSRIDPVAETQRYREHVLETKSAGLDESGRALLEEDLRSPCTEEIAVFQAFSRVIREAGRRFVVLDTAPTGHTLLLLDATGAYHREVTRHATDGARFTTPMMRLQNPEQTKILIATLPETTPVLEAAALQDDLRRAGIEPWAWVVNASLAAAGPTDPLLVARARAEVAQIDKVRNTMSQRMALVPWLAREPVGVSALRAMCRPTGEREATVAQHERT